MALVCRVANLGQYWPKTKPLATKTVEAASAEYFIGPYHARKREFPVLEQVGQTTCVKAWIPPRYHPALRFLNFKNACFISALTVEADINDMVADEATTYANMRDGMSRQIVFNDKIRGLFFKELENAGMQKRKGPMTQQGVVRSPAMDTWLIEEYLYRNHDRTTRRLLLRNHPSYQDPLELGASTETFRTKSHISHILINGLLGFYRLGEMG
jgi:hypothetical protein